MASTNIEQIKVNEEAHAVGLRNMSVSAKGNLEIVTSADLGNTSKGKINIESMNDIQIKSGDDVAFYAHHREAGKHDEVSVKVLTECPDGVDRPVKLQLNVAEINLTTKDKDTSLTYPDNSDTTTPSETDATKAAEDKEVLDLRIKTGNKKGNTMGYLKVRARAIDLRCEEHGGIALQPYGSDSETSENKIKFEHGGGDGLEFGTFNTDKTSLFTNEYRFNKDGIVKMATRTKEVSDKYVEGEETTHYKYVKQSDDFYDVIDTADATTTWGDIITTASKKEDLIKLLDYAKTQGWI